MSKKLTEMDRDELLVVVQALVKVLERKRTQHLPDLPPNKLANARHQRMKQIWGRKKGHLLRLLNQALPYLPEELAADVKYQLDHDDYLYARRNR